MLEELMKFIFGEGFAASDIIETLAGLFSVVFALAWANIRKKLTTNTLVGEQKDAQITALQTEVNELKETVSVLIEMQTLAFMASRGLDTSVKANVAQLSERAKALTGQKFSDVLDGALTRVLDGTVKRLSEAGKLLVEKQAAAVKETVTLGQGNVSTNQEDVDKLL